ncbi:DUF4023 domain-containing protein [Paenibacillus thermoaerophilus]|jgi:hypothetical protein|uniref:DUF4023 domain-containing protein n=1 Tax=Paenibacillus thermoaerophilus TaxID=1215385 RepID=A0ABW2UZL7_9BACL|nr:DUF4023 domain-containing protein [Paenibacillus thermoaerophilus]TMV14339.1 DUF4023 domain-containing protein [Paenibacillus thermoaerophilus]
MSDTGEFVAKLHDTQQKAEKNKAASGSGNPGKQLPNKQKGTGK